MAFKGQFGTNGILNLTGNDNDYKKGGSLTYSADQTYTTATTFTTYGPNVSAIDANKIKVPLTITTGGTTLASVTAGSGADVITVNSSGLKYVNAGAGNNIVMVSANGTGLASVVAGKGNDEISISSLGTTKVDLVDAGAGNDAIDTRALHNVINLGDGNDDLSMSTGAVADLVVAGKGNDIITLLNGAEAKIIEATEGNNTFELYESAKATINGGKGADTFNIDAGATASVSGGAGNDVFIIDGTGTGVITIADYSDGSVLPNKTYGTDRIVYDGITADKIQAIANENGTITLKLTSPTYTTASPVNVTVQLASSAEGVPLNIYSTNLNGIDPETGKAYTDKTKKAASQAAYKTPVFSQAAISTQATQFVITDKNVGTSLFVNGFDNLKKIDASTTTKNARGKDVADRSKAVNIVVNSDSSEDVEIIGSGKNDTINLSGEAAFKVSGGAGNDIYEIASGTTVTITDFDLNKDIIKFAAESGITSLDDITITNKTTDAADETKTVHLTANGGQTKIDIVGALWDGSSKNQNLLVQLGTAKAASLYAGDQDAVAITTLPKDSTNKNITDFDFSAVGEHDSLTVGSNTISGKVITYTSATNSVSFAAVNAKLNITAGDPEITASKGNDTIKGAIPTLVPTYTTVYALPLDSYGAVDGSAGNDYFIGNVGGGSFTGGVGNDTFRSGSDIEAHQFDKFTDEDGDVVEANVMNVTGGAGNDVFVATAEGDIVVNDYTNVVASDDASKKRKTDNGTDKIIISNDPYGNVNSVSRVYAIDSAEFNGTSLTLGLVGKLWNHEGGMYRSGDFDNDTSGSIKLNNLQFGTTDQFDVTFEGINYKQLISSETAVTAAGNYLGYLNPNATSITLASTAKAAKLVGNENTATIVGASKNDTLVYNDYSDQGSLVGGDGSDAFDIRNSTNAVIADYNGTGAAKEKDIILVNSLSDLSVEYADNGTDLIVGSTTIKGGVGKAITFAQIDEQETTKNTAKRGDPPALTITGVKNVQTTMVRTFTSDTTNAASTVISGGTSDYLEVYYDDDNNSIDNAVKVVKAGSKATTMRISGNAIEEVTGSGKADDILIVQNEGDVPVSLKTGGGNDTLKANSNGVYVTDFTKGTQKSATDPSFKAGDILDFTDTDAPEITDGVLSAEYDNQDVIIGGITLKGMKDQSIWVQYQTDTGSQLALVKLENTHEFAIPSTVTNSKGAQIDASAANSDITVIDATKYTKNAVITPGDYVTEIYAGKGVDTIYASAGADAKNDDAYKVYIDSGAGADLIVFDSTHATTETIVESATETVTTPTRYVLPEYTNDKIVLDGVAIKSAAITGSDYEATTKGKGAKAVTTTYSDVTLTLSDNRQVILQKVANVGDAGFKIYVQDGTANNAPVQYLEYGTSDVTIANADGNVINLTGAGITVDETYKLNAKVDSARSKALTIEGAAAGTVIDVNTDSTNKKGAATTFIGNTYSEGYTELVGNIAATYTTYTAGSYTYTTVTATINGKEYKITLSEDSDIVAVTGEGAKVNDGAGSFSIGDDTSIKYVVDAQYDEEDYDYETITGYEIVQYETHEAEGVNAPVTFKGGVKADKYVGGGSKDIVDFTRGGANTVDGGNATVTFGTAKANDTVLVKARNGMTLSGFAVSGTDKLILDNNSGNFDASLEYASYYDNGDGDSGVRLVFANTYTSASVNLKNYSGEEIAISQNYMDGKKQKNKAMQTLSFGIGTAYDGEFDEDVTAIVSVKGGKAADWIDVYGTIATVDGGAGNDTISISQTYTTVTVSNFGQGNNVLTFTTAFKLNNYSSDYVYDGGTDVTIRSDYGDVVLQGVAAAPKTNTRTGVTTYNAATKAIRFEGETDATFGKNKNSVNTGLALSNNVTITGAAANKNINLTDKGMYFTREYNNSTNQVTDVTAGTGLVSYKAGTKADKLTTTNNEYAEQITYTFAAQAKTVTDEIILKSNFVSVYDNDKAQYVEVAPIALDYVKEGNKALSYVASVDKVGDNTVTLNFKTGTKAAGTSGSLKITDDSESGDAFTYGETLTLGTDDGTIASYNYTAFVNGGGLKDVQVASSTVTVKSGESVVIDGRTVQVGTTANAIQSYGASETKTYSVTLSASNTNGNSLNGTTIQPITLQVGVTEDNNTFTVNSVSYVSTSTISGKEDVLVPMSAIGGVYTYGTYQNIKLTPTEGKLAVNYDYEISKDAEHPISSASGTESKVVDITTSEEDSNTSIFTLGSDDYTLTYTTSTSTYTLKDKDGDTVKLTSASGDTMTFVLGGVSNTFTIDSAVSKVSWTANVSTRTFTAGDGTVYTINYEADAYGNTATSSTPKTVVSTVKSYTTNVEISGTTYTFKLPDISEDEYAVATIASDGSKVTTDDEHYTLAANTEGMPAANSKSFVEKAYAEDTTSLFSDFITASVNDLDSITTKTYNEAAITADLTTNFAAQGNTFDLTSALAAKKKNTK